MVTHTPLPPSLIPLPPLNSSTKFPSHFDIFLLSFWFCFVTHWATHLVMTVRLSPGAWGTHLWLCHWKQWLPFPSTAISFFGQYGATWTPPLAMTECRWAWSYVGNHSFCEFMSAVALSTQDSISQPSFWSSGFYIISMPPYVFSISWRDGLFKAESSAVTFIRHESLY